MRACRRSWHPTLPPPDHCNHTEKECYLGYSNKKNLKQKVSKSKNLQESKITKPSCQRLLKQEISKKEETTIVKNIWKYFIKLMK